MANSGDTDLIGQQLGEFQVLRRLGKGGMAEVYLAEQKGLDRRVAIKVLRSDLVSETDETHLKRFEREARAAAALTHPNIVQVYSVGTENGVHYIAQEYVPGVNLKEYLTKKGPASLSVVLHIMKQVTEALLVAGEAGIVHRDIKPENIMLTKKGEAKVADFGLAQLGQAGDQMGLTQEGVTMGTPLYMSPEQVRGNAVDHRSDIYSFGVTCYHLLTGHPPFSGETALAVAVQHINEAPQPLTETREDLPRPLIEIIGKMMEKSPDRRYQNCGELRTDLRRFAKLLKQNSDASDISLSEFSVARSDASIPTTGSPVDPATARKRELIALAISAVLVAGTSSALGWFLRPGDLLQQYPATNTSIGQSSGEDPAERLALALSYLTNGQFPEAEAIFEDLTSGANSQKADGYAGLALIAYYRDDHSESQRLILREVRGRRNELSPELRVPVQRAYTANRRVLGPDSGPSVENAFPSWPVEKFPEAELLFDDLEG